MANSVEAAKMLADITGKPREICQHQQRRLGEAGLIHRGSRGRSAQQVTERELAIMVIAVMATTDSSTPAVQIPKLAERIATLEERIATLDKGPYPELFLMELPDVEDGPKELTAFGSFVETLTKVIEGHEDPRTGPVQSLGLQFCRGSIRAWVEWKETGKVFFGVHKLPPGMVQEAVIDTGILDALRQILRDSPSVAADGSETTTPTQFAARSASVPSESPRDANRDAPLMHRQNMRKDSEKREKKQALDSGRDSPSSNAFGSERASRWQTSEPQMPCAC